MRFSFLVRRAGGEARLGDAPGGVAGRGKARRRGEGAARRGKTRCATGTVRASVAWGSRRQGGSRAESAPGCGRTLPRGCSRSRRRASRVHAPPVVAVVEAADRELLRTALLH